MGGGSRYGGQYNICADQNGSTFEVAVSHSVDFKILRIYGKVFGISMGLLLVFFRVWYPNGLFFFHNFGIRMGPIFSLGRHTPTHFQRKNSSPRDREIEGERTRGGERGGWDGGGDSWTQT